MKRAGILAMTGLLAIAGATAEAGTITAQFTGGLDVRVVYAGGAVNTKAGDFKVTVIDDTGLAPLSNGDQFYTFCVDLQHTATSPVNTTFDYMSNWNLHAPVTAEQLSRASFLGQRYFNLFPTGLATNLIAAAYQVAIWELLYETSGGYGTGTGTALITMRNGADPNVLTQADSLIALSAGRDNYDAGWLVTENNGRYAQDFMAPVPDPLTSLGAFAVGLLSLGGMRRRLRA